MIKQFFYIIERAIKETLQERKSIQKNDDEVEMIRMFLPYEKGLSEKISRTCKKYNVKLIHTQSKALKNVLKTSKMESEEIEKESGVVYKVNCGDCQKCYIGETGRQLKIRLKEHERGSQSEDLSKMSGLSQHVIQTKHNIKFDEVKILYRESNFSKRKFKEGLAIKKSELELLNKKEEIRSLTNMGKHYIKVNWLIDCFYDKVIRNFIRIL